MITMSLRRVGVALFLESGDFKTRTYNIFSKNLEDITIINFNRVTHFIIHKQKLDRNPKKEKWYLERAFSPIY